MIGYIFRKQISMKTDLVIYVVNIFFVVFPITLQKVVFVIGPPTRPYGSDFKV